MELGAGALFPLQAAAAGAGIVAANLGHAHRGGTLGTSLSRCLLLAEMVGFEPTCPIKDKTISSRSRYDHFDTSPYSVPLESHGKLISRTIQA